MKIKFFVFILLSVFFLSSCKKVEKYKKNESYELKDVSYGKDKTQKMDIYLPSNRSTDKTKLFVLIHGGGWSGGDKSELNGIFNTFKTLYPNHAIININYRLGSKENPGFPMQINDIQSALNEIRSKDYNISNETFMLGGSAGAHLALLYSYVYDKGKHVQGVCNIVGPTDFTDPFYENNFLLQLILQAFVGNYSYSQNPELYTEVSPAKQVSSSSPKTISFYGDADELVPPSQMQTLHEQLDAFGVYNEYTLYPGEGHGNWNEEHLNDFALKVTNFINAYFDY